MTNRIILNETSYFGRGSREKVAEEIAYAAFDEAARGYVTADEDYAIINYADMRLDVLMKRSEERRVGEEGSERGRAGWGA